MENLSLQIPDSLQSIKDYIRWGASQFSNSKLYFGHGTENALDEAAAIVLHTINQPYNLQNDYLDTVLTWAERKQITELFNRRIEEKIPSAYLTREAIFAGLPFYVDDRVLVPRSPIAELIEENFTPWIEADKIFNVLDLCTGSGCIGIACAYAFPEAHVDLVELSFDAIDVAKINIEKHHMTDQVSLIQSDLFLNLKQNKYNLIISNPPYVSQQEWESLPAEFHKEPAIGFQGGESGLDLVIRILAQAVDFLTTDGILIVEVGNSAQRLQDRFPKVPFFWFDFTLGGDGVFLLTAEQLAEHRSLFASL